MVVTSLDQASFCDFDVWKCDKQKRFILTASSSDAENKALNPQRRKSLSWMDVYDVDGLVHSLHFILTGDMCLARLQT